MQTRMIKTLNVCMITLDNFKTCHLNQTEDFMRPDKGLGILELTGPIQSAQWPIGSASTESKTLIFL
jgi:hypothetical protein